MIFMIIELICIRYNNIHTDIYRYDHLIKNLNDIMCLNTDS